MDVAREHVAAEREHYALVLGCRHVLTQQLDAYLDERLRTLVRDLERVLVHAADLRGTNDLAPVPVAREERRHAREVFAACLPRPALHPVRNVGLRLRQSDDLAAHALFG